MGLLAVPGTLGRNVATSSTNRCTSPATGAASFGNPEGGEVVGLEAAVELGPCDIEHRLVGQPESLEHRDRFVRRIVDGQLHVREHTRVVAVGDEERASLPRCLLGESVAVDQANAVGERVDAHTGPRQVEERHRTEDLHLDLSSSSRFDQQVDRTFEHVRRARHGIQDLVARCPGRSGQEIGHDPDIHIVECVGRFVMTVERVASCTRNADGWRRSVGSVVGCERSPPTSQS